MATTFQVILERDGSGWWLARIPAMPGCHTQGKSIDQALHRVREALALWVDDADRAILEPDIRLPSRLRAVVTRTRRARESEARAHEAARSALGVSVRALTESGMSTRDAARLLGISHQRVHQLTS